MHQGGWAAFRGSWPCNGLHSFDTHIHVILPTQARALMACEKASPKMAGVDGQLGKGTTFQG